MGQFRGWRTTVVHLRIVNRLSPARNAEITGKVDGIVKLASIGRHYPFHPIFHDHCWQRSFEGWAAACVPDSCEPHGRVASAAPCFPGSNDEKTAAVT